MSSIQFSEEVEKKFTVDEMIGVLKWLKMTGEITATQQMDCLLEYRELGLGECSVANCKKEVKC